MCIVFCMVAFLLGYAVCLLLNKKFRTRPYDGKVIVTEGYDGSKLFSLEFDGDPMTLDEKEMVAFKVMKPKVDEVL